MRGASTHCGWDRVASDPPSGLSLPLTVLPRTEKYKAKNFNDTFVYRLGDQVGAWSYTAIGWLGLGVAGLALTMVPLSAAWLLLALWLGARSNLRSTT